MHSREMQKMARWVLHFRLSGQDEKSYLFCKHFQKCFTISMPDSFQRVIVGDFAKKQNALYFLYYSLLTQPWVGFIPGKGKYTQQSRNR